MEERFREEPIQLEFELSRPTEGLDFDTTDDDERPLETISSEHDESQKVATSLVVTATGMYTLRRSLLIPLSPQQTRHRQFSSSFADREKFVTDRERLEPYLKRAKNAAGASPTQCSTLDMLEQAEDIYIREHSRRIPRTHLAEMLHSKADTEAITAKAKKEIDVSVRLKAQKHIIKALQANKAFTQLQSSNNYRPVAAAIELEIFTQARTSETTYRSILTNKVLKLKKADNEELLPKIPADVDLTGEIGNLQAALNQEASIIHATEILQRLATCPVSSASLSANGNGKIVKNLRKHEHSAISNAAQYTFNTWKLSFDL